MAGLGVLAARTIGDALGVSLKPLSLEPVGGGCIHRAGRLIAEIAEGRRSWFLKGNEFAKAPMFEAEASGLRSIAKAGAVRVPEVVALGSDEGEDLSWIALEWLELSPLDARGGAKLGAALAAQHRRPQPKFGWPRDNFIGSSPQSNVLADEWLDFWRAHRLQAQLRLAAHNRLPSSMIDRGERLLADCGAFFAGYAPEKSLLHGDLWGGNAASLDDHTPVIFDPAIYVGDREAEVAMTELFGGFPPDFHAAYRNAWPLADGYATRRDFYNLYHVLNHANLFAGDYVRDSERRIEKLLAEIG